MEQHSRETPQESSQNDLQLWLIETMSRMLRQPTMRLAISRGKAGIGFAVSMSMLTNKFTPCGATLLQPALLLKGICSMLARQNAADQLSL